MPVSRMRKTIKMEIFVGLCHEPAGEAYNAPPDFIFIKCTFNEFAFHILHSTGQQVSNQAKDENKLIE